MNAGTNLYGFFELTVFSKWISPTLGSERVPAPGYFKSGGGLMVKKVAFPFCQRRITEFAKVRRKVKTGGMPSETSIPIVPASGDEEPDI